MKTLAKIGLTLIMLIVWAITIFMILYYTEERGNEIAFCSIASWMIGAIFNVIEEEI